MSPWDSAACRRHRHLLIFKNQTLTDEQLLAFANYFGDILQQPAYVRKGETEEYLPPLVLTLANAAPEESSVNIRPNYQELLPHIDHYWLPVPSSGSFLYAVEVPENGPNTYWVNLAQAYDELDDATKQQITGLQARYFNFYGSRDRDEYGVIWTKFISGPPLLEALSVGSIDLTSQQYAAIIPDSIRNKA